MRSGRSAGMSGSRTFRQTSRVIEPADGRIPPITPEAQRRVAMRQAQRSNAPSSWEDRSLYDRCITRGIMGSTLPVIYGNGNQIFQTPNSVVINYEMVHDTRVIPLDGRPHVGSKIRTYLGDARGQWEGNTLVVETTNFLDNKTGIGGNGGGAPTSEMLRSSNGSPGSGRRDPVRSRDRRSEDVHPAVEDRDDAHDPARLPDPPVRVP